MTNKKHRTKHNYLKAMECFKAVEMNTAKDKDYEEFVGYYFKFIKGVVLGLCNIRELMDNGMFQLDNETESEMMDCGVIEMDTKEMALCLDNAVDLLRKVTKNG